MNKYTVAGALAALGVVGLSFKAVNTPSASSPQTVVSVEINDTSTGRLLDRFSSLPNEKQTTCLAEIMERCDQETGVAELYEKIVDRVGCRVLTYDQLKERAKTDKIAEKIVAAGESPTARAFYSSELDAIVALPQGGRQKLEMVLMISMTERSQMAHESLHKVTIDELKKHHAPAMSPTGEIVGKGFRYIDTMTECQARYLTPGVIGGSEILFLPHFYPEDYGFPQRHVKLSQDLMPVLYGIALDRGDADIVVAQFIGRYAPFTELQAYLKRTLRENCKEKTEKAMFREYERQGKQFLIERAKRLDKIPLVADVVLRRYE